MGLFLPFVLSGAERSKSEPSSSDPVLPQPKSAAAKEKKSDAFPPTPVLAFSQLGYLPSQSKHAVLTADPKLPIEAPRFSVFRFPSEEKVLEGNLSLFEKHFWHSKEWIADFSELKEPGSYWVEVSWNQGTDMRSLRTSVFPIEESLYRMRIIPSQFSFFHEYRCGLRCHTKSPLPGGYHDATGDWGVRMWSMPFVVYGFSRYLEADPVQSNDAREELRFAVDWCLKMQGPNGEVWSYVGPPDGIFFNNIRPWQDKSFRQLEKKDQRDNRLPYIGAMARASGVLKSFDPTLSEKALAAAVKSWKYTIAKAEQWSDTGDIGEWIWAAVELYKTTGAPEYLDEAKKYAVLQLKCQHRNTSEVEDAAVCGDFFENESMQRLGNHQYKTFLRLGIYAGLIELHHVLPPSDPLWWPVHAALERLLHGYFERMASVTPYGVVGKALEREAPSDKFTIRFFDNKHAWGGAHFGYNSDYLAEGLMVLDYARQIGDARWFSFAEDQVQWIFGNNPLGYCMIDGMGARLAPMVENHIAAGRTFGGIPNGFEGVGPDNLPVWGDLWDSREYWLPHNAAMLALLANLQWKRNIEPQQVPFSWNVDRRDGKVVVKVSAADTTGRHLELLVDGGSMASQSPIIENETTTWSIEPAPNEPVILLLRDSEKLEVYLQTFL